MTAELLLTADVYTLAAAKQAAAEFRHLCRVDVQSAGDDTRVTITELSASRAAVVDEFLNYVLALSAEELLN